MSERQDSHADHKRAVQLFAGVRRGFRFIRNIRVDMAVKLELAGLKHACRLPKDMPIGEAIRVAVKSTKQSCVVLRLDYEHDHPAAIELLKRFAVRRRRRSRVREDIDSLVDEAWLRLTEHPPAMPPEVTLHDLDKAVDRALKRVGGWEARLPLLLEDEVQVCDEKWRQVLMETEGLLDWAREVLADDPGCEAILGHLMFDASLRQTAIRLGCGRTAAANRCEGARLKLYARYVQDQLGD